MQSLKSRKEEDFFRVDLAVPSAPGGRVHGTHKEMIFSILELMKNDCVWT